jgi:hypothetical protein
MIFWEQKYRKLHGLVLYFQCFKTHFVYISPGHQDSLCVKTGGWKMREPDIYALFVLPLQDSRILPSALALRVGVWRQLALSALFDELFLF